MDEAATVELHVHRWGVGQDKRALLVHGVAANGDVWWRVAEQLAAAGYEVWAPDLRGHGRSPASSSYRFADFAADLQALGDEWDLLVGHSLGGPICCTLLATGVRATRTVLVDPVLEIADEDLEDVVTAQVAEADPVAMPATFAEANPRWHPLDAHAKAAAARAVSAWTVEQAIRQNAPWHHLPLADALQMPTVLLGADPEVFALLPPEQGEALAATLPDARFEVVSGTGHGIQREDPDAVVRAALGDGAEAPGS
jgi:pimeloyl-ACP methyl ester carboxylesterase